MYYGNPVTKRKLQYGDEYAESRVEKRTRYQPYAASDDQLSDSYDSGESSPNTHYTQSRTEYEQLRETFLVFLIEATKCSVQQLEGDYSNLEVGYQTRLVCREEIIRSISNANDAHNSWHVLSLKGYFRNGGIMDQLKLEPGAWVQHFCLEEDVQAAELDLEHLIAKDRGSKSPRVSVTIEDGVFLTVKGKN